MKFVKSIKKLALAAVVSFGAVSAANANTVLYDNVIAPNIPADVELKFDDYDMGTVYNFTQVGQVYTDTGDDTNANDINNAANIAQTALGAEIGSNGEEDTWGIALVSSLDLGNPVAAPNLWSDGDLGQELTIMFYNATDFHTSFDGTSQVTSSKGMIIDIYESSTATNRFDPTLGSAGRNGLDSYDNVTDDGTLVLRLVSEAGHILAPGGLDTEVLTKFNPTASGAAGEGQGFFSVVAGAWASAFDSNIYKPLDNAYNAADLKIQFTTFANPAAGGQPVGDWLVTSDDPATARVVPLPGAASMGFGLMGLIGLARKRRAA